MLTYPRFEWPLLQTSIVGLTVFLIVYLLLRRGRSKNLPPGPRPLPLLGNLLQLRTPATHRQFFEWSKTYGPVISVYFGPSLAIVVNDIDTALEVLVKRSVDFATRAKYPSTDLISDEGRDIAFGEYGPVWRLQRKLASKALRQYLQGPELDKRIHDAVTETFKLMEQETTPYDPAMHVTLIITNVLCGMCFGENYEIDNPEFRQLIEISDKVMTLLGEHLFLEDFVPGLTYFPTKTFRTVRDMTTDVYVNIFGKKYTNHKETFDGENIRDFTDFLIQAKMEADEEDGESVLDQLTDRNLIQIISDVFFGGVDTSRYTLRFAILYMAMYPEIQCKVQEELDSVLEKDELPCVSHRSRLAYTEAVLHECMRLGTVAPCGVPHKTTCDTKILGYDIPKDTDVIINHWALHNDPDNWKDVDKFIPERYLDDEGKLGPKPKNWLPFSAGRRVCIGESVAKLELHLIFAALMHHFTWRLPEGVEADLDNVENLAVCYPKAQNFITSRRH